jgi:hypothetical protein
MNTKKSKELFTHQFQREAISLGDVCFVGTQAVTM